MTAICTECTALLPSLQQSIENAFSPELLLHIAEVVIDNNPTAARSLMLTSKVCLYAIPRLPC